MSDHVLSDKLFIPFSTYAYTNIKKTHVPTVPRLPKEISKEAMTETKLMTCQSCKQNMDKTNFSKSQIKKGKKGKLMMCKHCVNKGSNDGTSSTKKSSTAFAKPNQQEDNMTAHVRHIKKQTQTHTYTDTNIYKLVIFTLPCIMQIILLILIRFTECECLRKNQENSCRQRDRCACETAATKRSGARAHTHEHETT